MFLVLAMLTTLAKPVSPMNATGSCTVCQAWAFANMLRIEVMDPVRMMDDAAFFYKNHANPGGASITFIDCAPELVPLLAKVLALTEVFVKAWCSALAQLAHSESIADQLAQVVIRLAPGKRSHINSAHASFGSIVSNVCGDVLALCHVSAIWSAVRMLDICRDLAELSVRQGTNIGGVGFCLERFGWTSGEWRSVARVLPAEHFLFRRAITKGDYEEMFREEVELSADLALEQSLPLSASFRTAYLVQGAVGEEFSSVWAYLPATASLLALTFREQFSGAIYFPDSTMNEGRNLLYFAARLAERNQGWRYDYFITLEPEVKFLRSGFVGFERFLQTWQPAVGVPGYFPAYASEGYSEYHEGDEDAYAIGRIDFHFIAYHWASLAELWPMDTRQDLGGCWWGAHWLQQQLMSLKYRGFVLAHRRVIVHNEIHAPYPKVGCPIIQSIIDTWLQSLLAPDQRHCIISNDALRGRAWGRSSRGPPRHEAGHYSPWETGSLDPSSCVVEKTTWRTSSSAFECEGSSRACATYPLRPSEILRRPLHIYAPPGNPNCFVGMEALLQHLGEKTFKTPGNHLKGMPLDEGAAGWRGCCFAYADGVEQVMFGFTPCWSGPYHFDSCCYVEAPSVTREASLLPLGEQALNPDRFGINWDVMNGSCTAQATELPYQQSMTWYVCDASSARYNRQETFETIESKKHVYSKRQSRSKWHIQANKRHTNWIYSHFYMSWYVRPQERTDGRVCFPDGKHIS